MNHICRLLLLLALFSFQKIPLSAQSVEAGTYIKVTYLHVEPDAIRPLFDGAETGWAPDQRKRVNNGDLLRWHFYKVPYSSNNQRSYNFVSLEVGATLNALQTATGSSARYYNELPGTKTFQKYAVHSEIWVTESVVQDEIQVKPGRYMNVNYMMATPGRLSEYLELEIDIARPLHMHQMNNNRMDGWAFHRLVFPTGTATPYNFITADFYNSLEQIEMGITRWIIEEVHPDMDVDEFEEFADAIRERVFSDLWELLEYAIAE